MWVLYLQTWDSQLYKKQTNKPNKQTNTKSNKQTNKQDKTKQKEKPWHPFKGNK